MVSPYVIGGPTGSGKSAYALELAQKIDGEIICADSRQVYARMVIGTASPTEEEKALVPHHNYNIVDTRDSYDAGRFVADTDRAVAEIQARGKTPILVGGTGLYLRCWRYGLSDVPERNEKVRQGLQAELAERGLPSLYDELIRVDEDSAQKIMANDAFRIVRALEIFRATQEKPSTLRKSHFDTTRVEAQWLLFRPIREELNARLLIRTKNMFESGLVDEAIALRQHLGEHPLLQTIGYKESLEYADGIIDKAAAIERTFIRTRQYAKRQASWFAKETYWTTIQP
jgi:tRNA dimethylallyltransferase